MISSVDLSPQQAAALDRVRAWLADPWSGRTSREPGVFRLFGRAGTGKSTVTSTLVAGVERVRFAAFTGKAARVMQRKGCDGASTIHRLIYLPRQKCQKHLAELAEKLRTETDPDRRRELAAEHALERTNLARPSWTLNVSSELREADLLVLDEVSMVGAQTGGDLLSFEVPILAIGDPWQLPPVRDRGYFTDPRQEADVLLTEVHRQAAGSPILDLAGRAARCELLPVGDYAGHGHETSRVVARGQLPIAEAATFDQIVCGRNATRRALNQRVRAHLGLPPEPLPVPGDRLVCLRNDRETGLLNGGQWICQSAERLGPDELVLDVLDPDTDTRLTGLPCHAHYFRGEEPAHYDARNAQCFDFAYAVTCHKAQGDQWPRVCVVDESAAFGPDASRWLYTAVTRASESVTIVR